MYNTEHYPGSHTSHYATVPLNPHFLCPPSCHQHHLTTYQNPSHYPHNPHNPYSQLPYDDPHNQKHSYITYFAKSKKLRKAQQKAIKTEILSKKLLLKWNKQQIHAPTRNTKSLVKEEEPDIDFNKPIQEEVAWCKCTGTGMLCTKASGCSCFWVQTKCSASCLCTREHSRCLRAALTSSPAKEFNTAIFTKPNGSMAVKALETIPAYSLIIKWNKKISSDTELHYGHSKNPNATSEKWVDASGHKWKGIFASKEIHKGEEITVIAKTEYKDAKNKR